MFNLGAIYSQMVLDIKGQWSNSVKTVQRDTKLIKGELNHVKQAAREVSFAMAAIGGAVTAAFGLMAREAMRVEESENLFRVSMGNMADAAKQWSEDVSDALGLNRYEVRQTVGMLNTMLESMGLNEQAAYKMAQGITLLGQDMASFYNLPVEEAFQKLRAGISGETEPLKRLGILVDEATVQQTAWRHGIAKTGEELTQQQKVLGRYVSIMEQTRNAQGDLQRTIDSTTNVMRRLHTRWQEISAELGQALTPAIGKAGRALDTLLQLGAQWVNQNRETAQTLALVTAGAGAATAALGVMGLALPKVLTGLKAIGTVAALPFRLLTLSVSGAVAAIALIASSVYALHAAWKTNFSGMRDMLQDWGDGIRAVWNKISEWVGTAIDFWTDLFSGWIKWAGDKFKTFANFMIAGWVGSARAMNTLFASRFTDFKGALAAFRASYEEDFVGPLLEGGKYVAEKAAEMSGIVVGKIGEGIATGAKATAEFFKEYGQTVEAQFDADMDSLIAKIKGKFPQIAAAMKQVDFSAYDFVPDMAAISGAITAEMAKIQKEGKAAKNEFKSMAELESEAILKTADAVVELMRQRFEAQEKLKQQGEEIWLALNPVEDMLARLASDVEALKAAGRMDGETASLLAEAAWNQFGDVGVVELQKVIDKLGEIDPAIAKAFEKVLNKAQMQERWGSVNGVINAMGNLVSALPSKFERFKQVASAALRAVQLAADLAKGAIGWVEFAINMAAEAIGLFGDKGEKELSNIEKMFDDLEQKIDEWADRLTDTLLEFVKTGKASFKDLVNSILEDLTRIAIHYAISEPLAQLVSGAFAKGAAFYNGAVTAFASGGVVSKPIIFPMKRGMGLMGEDGPEAVLPLKRLSGGRLGVSAQVAPVEVNVIDQRGQGAPPIEVTERRSANGMRSLQILVKGVVNELMATGELDTAMATNFGLMRRGYAR